MTSNDRPGGKKTKAHQIHDEKISSFLNLNNSPVSIIKNQQPTC